MRQRSIELEGLGHTAPIPLACRVGPLLATSTIGGKDPKTGKQPADAEGQAANAFANLQSVLSAAGMDLGDVVRITVLVRDEGVRDAVNKAWLHHYPDEHHRPARLFQPSDLRPGTHLQLEAIACARDA